jgi:hypothetical protein
LSTYNRKYYETRWLSNDVYARPRRSDQLGSQVDPLPNSVGEQSHGRRKAEPANVPLRVTLDWAAQLPLKVRPAVLLRQFARIANLVAATWDDPVAFDSYMDGLLTDKRGNRKGFPPAVHHELLALKQHRTLCPKGMPERGIIKNWG